MLGEYVVTKKGDFAGIEWRSSLFYYIVDTYGVNYVVISLNKPLIRRYNAAHREGYMYLNFFNLSEQPFDIAPNIRYLYLGRSHEAALTTLKYGVNERQGFLLLTGEVGTGKTTLVRALLEHLDERTHTALLINPLLSVTELICTINRDFGLATRRASPKGQIDALNGFLLKVNAGGENAVLIIDEAQNLSPDALEAIRLLTNLETDRHKLLQIILVGQPELNDMLADHRLRQLAQRITTRANLEALDSMEMMRYINHRICTANGGGKIFFEPKAYRLIHKATKGYPRLINLICHRALMATYIREDPTVNVAAVKQAIADWGGDKRSLKWAWVKRLVFS